MITTMTIPKSMRIKDTWMTSNKNGSPCDANGYPISNSTISNFMSFDDAIKTKDINSEKVKYVSLALYNNFVCVDLDGAFNDDYQMYTWAYEIVQELRDYNCYMETSKSGKGLHIFFRTSEEFVNKKALTYQLNKYHQDYENLSDKCKIEIFSHGKNIIVTGDVFDNIVSDELNECPVWLEEFYNSLKKQMPRNQIEKKYNLDKRKQDNIFDQIKNMVSMETLLDHYEIEKDEKNNINCLFHDDENPSMKVYYNTNSFHCFGCKKGGSIIDFIMAKEDISTAFKAACWINKTFELNIDMSSFVDWDTEYCKVTQNGVLPLLSIANMEILLMKYDIELSYNEMNRKIYVKGDVFKQFGLTSNNQITDMHETQIRELCLKHHFQGIAKDTISCILNCIANKKKYHPVRDYFDQLKVEQSHKRLDTLNDLYKTLNYQEGHNDREQIEFRSMLIRKWLMNAYKAIYDHEFYSQGVLTLQGKQGMFKSTWLKMLCPVAEAFQGEFTGLDVHNKDSVHKATRYFMTEIAELESTFKKDFISLKAFLTAAKDIYRLPFTRHPLEADRRTIFAASVNSMQFLKDDTGDRRFWVLPVETIDLELMQEINIYDLWCEIKYLVENTNEIHYLTQEENAKLMSNNREFSVITNLDGILLEIISQEAMPKEQLNSRNYAYSSTEICKIIRDNFGNIPKLSPTSVGQSLNKLNLSQKKLSFARGTRGKRTIHHWINLNPEYVISRL